MSNNAPLNNIHLMKQSNNHGMDVVIVSTNHPQQQFFWKERLHSLKGTLLKKNVLILVIVEKWKGGAGNGLGTLYAFQEAQKETDIDLKKLLLDGASIALYHTAGYGKRLAPLPLIENNNKAAVLLPAYIPGTNHPMTILDAVLMQTSLFSKRGQGRLSVFWSDQLFIPSNTLTSPPQGHADVLFQSIPFPSKKEWEQKTLSNYGTICNGNEGPRLFEKIPHSTFSTLFDQNVFESTLPFGPCLGCFSLSPNLLEALLDTFSKELNSKSGSFNSDPDFWMPITLPEQVYLSLAGKEKKALLQRIKSCFSKVDQETPPFTATDIGPKSFWWDYGTISNYFKSNQILLQKNQEGEAMRSLFQSPPLDSSGNCIIGSEIKDLKAKNSILFNVQADQVNLNNSQLLNSRLHQLTGDRCLGYHIQDTNSITLTPGTVRADSTSPSNHSVPFSTSLERNGKEDWEVRLPPNPLSYQMLYEKNLSSTSP